jgi:hypothetical protein
MKTFLTSILALALIVSSCSLIGGGGTTTFDVCSAVSVTQVQQAVVESAATVVINMNKNGQVPAATLAKIQTAYQAWSDTQGLVVTALQAINDAGGNPSAISVQDYAQLVIQAASDAADFIALYESLVGSPSLTSIAKATASPTPTTCSITDADIAADLAVPAWSSL